MANKYIHETVSKFAWGVKRFLLVGGLAVLVACSSSSSTDNSESGKSEARLTSAQVAKFESERVGLMASLSKLYPNGQLTPEQAAAASKALSQNPAALHAQSKISKQDAIYSQAGVSLVGSDFLPVYRIQNTTLAGSYFFTIYESEKTAALASNPNWQYEGPAFYATTLQGDGLSPVWRFRNKVNGSYLYTIYESERAEITSTYAATFEYEGVSWYASQTPAAGYSPLHRFRNMTNGTYLFSAYESEKNEIIASYAAIFAYEGISYYVRVSPPPTDNKITGTVKDGLIVLPVAATSGSNTVVPLKAGGVQIDSTDISVSNLRLNDIVHIAPRSGGLAFPFAGKVASTTIVNSKQQVRLIPANVEDVYDSLSWDIDTSRSNAVIAGVIAPQNARASFSQTSGVPKAGGLISPQLSVNDSLKVEGAKISGKVVISQDIVYKGKTVTITATADVNNLSVRSKAEFDAKNLATGGGWANISAVITGDVGGSVALKGSVDGSLGDMLTNTDVWDELKWRGGEIFTLEGLDSRDKKGRIPLGGLVVVPYAATVFTGKIPDSAITLLSAAPSTVIWLYLDMNGNVTMEGEAGWRAADYKFEKGFEFVGTGLELQANKIDRVTQGRQELFAKGSIKATQRVGVSTAADILVGGIRPVNVNAFIGAEWSGNIDGEGVRELMPTQNVSGIVCVKNNIWIGSQLSASLRIKAKAKADLYFVTAEAEGLLQEEYTEPRNQFNTYKEADLGTSCVTNGLFSITANVQGPDASVAGNSVVNVNFTPAFNNTVIASKTKHWWVKASCTGCADINVEIPIAQAGIGTISLPTGKSYTLTLEAKSDDYGVIKSAITTVNINLAPTASFAVAGNSGSCSNIKLTATAATAGGRSTITSYAWTVQRAGAAVQNYTGNPVAAVPLPSCGSTAINLAVTDSLGYTTTVTQTIDTTNLGATITSVTPATATLNTSTVFTVTGTNLPLTAILAVADAPCLSPVNNTSTGFSQTCTPMATGSKTITVKTAPGASGGTVIDATRTVNVTTVPAPSTSLLTDTGITASQCYQAGSNVLVSCTSAAAIALNSQQDGMIGRDVTSPNAADGKLGFSYSTVSSYPITDCVKDNVTGLIWEGKTNDNSYRDFRASYLDPDQPQNSGVSIVAYVANVNAAVLCGKSDWRLPTYREISSLVDHSVSYPGPTIDITWLPNNSNNYWIAEYRNYISFVSGNTPGRNNTLTSGALRLVSGHVMISAYSYSSDGSEVVDLNTGLTWRRCSEGQTWSGSTCAGTAIAFIHEGALIHAKSQAGWRLPNIKELSSLLNVTTVNPTIDLAVFPATYSQVYWSSTPDLSFSAGDSRVVEFSTGGTGISLRTSTHYVRLVR
jgi:hypothetical protein